MGQACSVEGASCANTPRGSAREPHVVTELHQATPAAKLPGALSSAAASTAVHSHDSRRSTGDKRVSIGPAITAASLDDVTTTQVITAATADLAFASPASHADTPDPAATPATNRPFADDASLLTPVAEETLGATAAPNTAVESPVLGSAALPEHLANEFPAHSAAPDNSSSGEHQHREHLHASKHEARVEQCEHHATGDDSRRSSTDSRELRSTTSGQLHAATEHSIMSIAAASDHSCSSLAGEAAGDAVNDEVSQSVLQGVPSAAVSRMQTSSLDKDVTDEEDEEPPHAESSKAPEDGHLESSPAEASTKLPIETDTTDESAAVAQAAVETATDREAAEEAAPKADAPLEPVVEVPAVDSVEESSGEAVAEAAVDATVGAAEEPEAAGEATSETAVEAAAAAAEEPPYWPVEAEVAGEAVAEEPTAEQAYENNVHASTAQPAAEAQVSTAHEAGDEAAAEEEHAP